MSNTNVTVGVSQGVKALQGRRERIGLPCTSPVSGNTTLVNFSALKDQANLLSDVYKNYLLIMKMKLERELYK
jgi:hypothetical protein